MNQTAEKKTPQEWADYLGSTIYQLLTEGDGEGWVAGIPPDTAQRLKVALDAYSTAYEPENP